MENAIPESKLKTYDNRQICQFCLPAYFADETGVHPIDEFPDGILISLPEFASLMQTSVITVAAWINRGIVIRNEDKSIDVALNIRRLKIRGYKTEE